MTRNYFTAFVASLKRLNPARPNRPPQKLLSNSPEPEPSPNALALKLGMRRVEAELILKLNRMMSQARNDPR